MSGYKLPLCWLGKSQWVISEDQTRREQVITEAEVNLQCLCSNPMEAFFCMEGHMTECHVGMSCEEAECSHYEVTRLEESDDES